MTRVDSTSESGDARAAVTPRPRRKSRRWRVAAAVLLAAALAWLGCRGWAARGPVPATEIYRGVTYGCRQLPADAQGAGLMHWVRVDLAAPGIEIFTTPLDPTAPPGKEYHLRYTGGVVKEHGLAAAINGTLFNASGLPLPGRAARSAETIVSDHVVNHVDPHSFLLWFEDDLTPHLEHTRPPSDAVLRRAKWGIGGNVIGVLDGRVTPYVGTKRRDARTWIGIDPGARLLWMAVFDDVTEHRAAAEMLHLGATQAIPLDGGSSTEMAIGPDAVRVRSGSVMHSWVPNATHLGVRAQPLVGRVPLKRDAPR